MILFRLSNLLLISSLVRSQTVIAIRPTESSRSSRDVATRQEYDNVDVYNLNRPATRAHRRFLERNPMPEPAPAQPAPTEPAPETALFLVTVVGTPTVRFRRSADSTATAVPKLAVKDNHKPLFTECSSYKPSVKEEAPINTLVFNIKATDIDPPDAGGKVTYTFVTTLGEKERFRLDPLTGEIYTADVFDHDEPSREKDAYVTVRATDNGQPSLDDACTIKITIEDINDNEPVFDKVSYAESVPADLQLGREVMRISATDIDDGNNSIVHYQLDSNSPDASYFRIDPDNGVIFLSKPIQKPPGYKFKLSAIVNDMGVPSKQSSITLDITVVESNKKSPSFLEVPDGPIRLKENYNDFVNPIATVRAASNTPNEEKVNFELVQGQTEQTNKLHTFILEPEGDLAYVKLGNLLDYEKITEYTLTIRIQNNYRLAAETIITIEVEDVNDNIPVFSEIRSGKVSENEPMGTPVMQVRAIDLDGTSANNQVTYHLADSSDPFQIDPITGNITTTMEFDREVKSFYNIKISAVDNSESALIKGKHNIGQQTFLIEIADKNDNPPHFTQETYIAESIAENANINELVTQVTALDVDTASIVTYDIVSGNTYESFSIRNITGEIRVAKPLDYENMTEFSLDVRASDGVFEDYAKVVIRIENLNDNPPVFLDNYRKTIEEERLYEGCIVKLEAYDPDIKDRNAPQNIVFSLVKHEQKEFLSIDNDGCLRLTKALDRDQPSGFSRWQILIMAADHGGKLGSDSLRSTTEVILDLTDVNDNAPFLTNTQPVIWNENDPPGPVLTLTAKDYDAPENGPPFFYDLNSTASFDVKSRFKIQDNVLYAITEFDREVTKEYFVPILITDSGAPRQTGQSILHVIIGDRNDNPMGPGHSSVFVYNYKGDSPDTEIGRVYVEDLDDWDLPDKRFTWLPSFEERSPYFDVNSQTGMITMRQGTPNGTYNLNFNVTEENEPLIPFHWVEASVNVTIKDIPEEAVDKSGSIRFVNTTAEQFIVPELDGTSKKDKFHRRLAKLFNVSSDNVDVFTVANKQTVKDSFLDVRFSAHGSPYYPPEKLNTMVNDIQENLEDELSMRVYMVNIDECLIEREQCEDSCRNVLVKHNVPQAVYTNTTSFIGVSAHVEPECTCQPDDRLVCLNGGTPFADKCECPPGYLGPRCEQTSVGFHAGGWALYPPPPACHEGHITLTVTAHNDNPLIFYLGPQKKNSLLPVEDFLALELVNGYPVLLVNYGSGVSRLNNTAVHVADGKPHLIEIVLTTISVEMFVDRCKLTTCMSLGAPAGNKHILNVNGPLQIGGTNMDVKRVAQAFKWRYIPSDQPLLGCVQNFSYNEFWYDLGSPSYSKGVDYSCTKGMYTAVTFGIDTNFLVVILVCTAILIGSAFGFLFKKFRKSRRNNSEEPVLLLAVVVHRRRQDTWAEKELDDIRENIIAYEDEGGGEGDAGYDLHVLRQMYVPQAEIDTWKPTDDTSFVDFMRKKNMLPIGVTKCSDETCNLCMEGQVAFPRLQRLSRREVTSTGTLTQDAIGPPTNFRTDLPGPPSIGLPRTDVSGYPQRDLHIRMGDLQRFEGHTNPLAGIDDEYVPSPAREDAPPAAEMAPRLERPTRRVHFDPGVLSPVLEVPTPPPRPRHPHHPHHSCHPPFEVITITPTTGRSRRSILVDFANYSASYEPSLRIDLSPMTPPSPARDIYPFVDGTSDQLRHASIVAPRSVWKPRPRFEEVELNEIGSEEVELDEVRVVDPDLEEYGTPNPTNRYDFQHFSPNETREGVWTTCLRSGLPAAAPDISGFLDDKKEVLDRDPDGLNPFDDVRHYAYEGDGNTSGSLSSLASYTDDGDLNFTYLQEYGPPFSKLADLYGDGEEGPRSPEPAPLSALDRRTESWC